MESPFRDPLPDGLSLFETLRWTPGDGALRGDRHLARMARAARRLGFPFDGAEARALLEGLTGDAPLRVRLALFPDGRFERITAPYTPVQGVWRLRIAEARVRADDPWRGVKTTQRALYDAARAALPEDCDELLFLNERGTLCEGTITNLFVERGGVLLTPPLSAGCLPGILREELLETGRAREADLALEDLRAAPALYVGNSLRGLIPAVLAEG